MFLVYTLLRVEHAALPFYEYEGEPVQRYATSHCRVENLACHKIHMFQKFTVMFVTLLLQWVCPSHSYHHAAMQEPTNVDLVSCGAALAPSTKLR